MAISRNRKKSKVNSGMSKLMNKNSKVILSIVDAEDKDKANCKTCGTKREELSFQELPYTEKLHWLRCPHFSVIELYGYCSECQEASAIITK